MKKVVNKTKSFQKADQWDVSQNTALTLKERLRIAEQLKQRVYTGKEPDVRKTSICIRSKR